MSFNGINQYTGSHKAWDHVGNIIPDIEHSEGMRPHGHFKPASWLPVVFYDKHSEVWFTCLPGKAVSLDPDGFVMPTQYGLTSASVVYTQNDVDAGVIDITTGLPLTATKTVTLSNVDGSTSHFMGRKGVSFEDSVAKYPIGICPQPYVQWAGGDGSNPANFTYHNFIKQHLVPVLCDYVIKLPYVPAKTSSETVAKTTSGTLVSGTSGTHTRAQAIANATGRYNSTSGTVPVLTTQPVIALALNKVPLAKNTSRTVITLASNNSADDVSDVLVNERSSVSAVTQAGDFFVDYQFGVIFIYSSDGATVPTSVSGAAGTVSITYYQYEDANSGTISKFGQVVGADLKPGDFLKCDSNSNLVVDNTASFRDIIGQVIAFMVGPDEGLSKVRTAYNPAISTDSSGSMANGTAGSASANLGQMDQMPGSATGGYSSLVHYSGAANLTAIVNLVSR